MSEWKESVLEDILESLIDYRGKTPQKTDKGIPLITAKIIKGGTISKPDEFIAEDDYDTWMVRGIPKEGDVVLTTEAPLGEVAQLDNTKIALAQRVVCLRGKDKILNNTYLKYYFLSSKGHTALTSRETGTTVTGIKQSELRKVPIVYPPYPTQQRIAAILSSLDAKIENNNKVNAKLEEIAQNLFKEWFVDFGPFKDGKFVDSELGPIPEGWRVDKIANIQHTLETGKRPKGGAVAEGVPSIGAEHIKGMGTYDYSKTKYITEEFATKLKTGKIDGYELLIYKDGGKPGYFIPNFSMYGEGYPFEDCYLNEHVFKLDFNKNRGFNIFCYFFFQTEEIMNFLNAQGGKAAIPGINKNDIESINVFTPDNSYVMKFGTIVLPLFSKILKNSIENQRLATLRDTLLPKLMSGEIEV